VATLVALGRHEEALQLYAESNPELTCTGPIRVTPVTTLQALNLSLAFEKKANQECADQLLDSVLEQIQNMPRLGSFGYGIADVEVYARQGKIEQALETLRSAIDLRWRPAWWWWDHGHSSPHLENLREHPDFMAMMAEMEADMTSQLERIRSLENKHGGKSL
jgi:tetratricopeptide (TPR) repeat protein